MDQKQKEPTGTFSVKELAAYIGVCEKSARVALRRGLIPHIRLQKRYIISRAAIDKWLESGGLKAA